MQPMRYCSPVTVPMMVCHAPPMQFFTRRPPSRTILKTRPKPTTKAGKASKEQQSQIALRGRKRSMHRSDGSVQTNLSWSWWKGDGDRDRDRDGDGGGGARTLRGTGLRVNENAPQCLRQR